MRIVAGSDGEKPGRPRMSSVYRTAAEVRRVATLPGVAEIGAVWVDFFVVQRGVDVHVANGARR